MIRTKSAPRRDPPEADAATGTPPEEGASASRVLDRRSRRRAHGPDRRNTKRVSVDLLINRFLDGQPYMCRMLDISRTGARLAPILEPDPSRAPRFMGLQFQLPDRDDVLTAAGEAIRRGGQTVGVRFTNLPPDSAWAIESFLSFV
jgi:PilZ domain